MVGARGETKEGFVGALERLINAGQRWDDELFNTAGRFVVWLKNGRNRN